MTSRLITNVLPTTAFLSLFAFLSGCSEKPPTAPPPPPKVNLELGIPVSVDNLNVELTLLSVLNEGRCPPPDFLCDWPGMVTVNVLVVQGTDSNEVNLSVGGEFPFDDSRFLWPLDTLGLRLTLLNMSSPQSGGLLNASVQVEQSSGPGPPANVIITDLNPTAILVDPFDIDSVWIINSRLHMKVIYGGGCRRHLFSLFMSPDAFISSSPREANLYLRHYGAGDACRALVSEEIVFNLGVIAQQYRFTYAVEEPFQLNLFIPADSVNTERVISLLFEPPNDALP